MPQLHAAAILKSLKASHPRESALSRFIDELKSLLVRDFDSVLSVVRAHKLITQWKSLQATQFVSSELRRWLLSAPLSGKRKAQLYRHLQACEFVQSIFDEIDEQAHKLGIWSADADLFAKTILGFVEYRAASAGAQAAGLTKGVPELRGDPDKGLQHQRSLHDAIRDTADAACLILGQFSIRSVTRAANRIDNADVRTAFGIAHGKSILQQFFDNYAYLNWQAKMSGKTISFRAPHPDHLLLEHYTQQLLHAGDLLDSIPEATLRASFRDDPQGQVGADFASKSFGESLLTPDGEKLLDVGRKAAAQLTRKIRQRIVEVFDETVTLQTIHGSFAICELVDTWGFFYSLAYCAEWWRESRIKRASDQDFCNYAPVISKHLLASQLCKQVGCTVLQSEKLLDQFTAPHPLNGDWDLFYRPLVRLSGNDLAIATTFVGLSRFYRNVFSIAIRDSNLDVSARGFKPLSALCGRFLRAGFKAGINKKVLADGREVTDVDFFFQKDQILFLAQVKIVIEQDSAYEEWKVRTKLERAADQLERAMSNLDSIKDALLDELRISHPGTRVHKSNISLLSYATPCRSWDFELKAFLWWTSVFLGCFLGADESVY